MSMDRVYYFDTDKTGYVKVPNDGALTLDFDADVADLRALRHPRGIVSSKSGTSVFKAVELTRRPGAPVNGQHPMRMVLERL